MPLSQGRRFHVLVTSGPNRPDATTDLIRTFGPSTRAQHVRRYIINTTRNPTNVFDPRVNIVRTRCAREPSDIVPGGMRPLYIPEIFKRYARRETFYDIVYEPSAYRRVNLPE